MIFYLDFTTVRLPFSANELAAIENLGIFGSAGKCCIIGERRSIAAICEQDLAPRARKYFAYTYSAITQMQALFQLQHSVMVRRDIYSPSRTNGRWALPLDALSNTDHFESPMLTCEAATDYEIVKYLVGELARQSKLTGNVVWSAIDASAGGGQIVARARNSQTKVSPECFLVDSDKTHPASSLGSTAAGIKAAFGTEAWFRRLLIWDAHEIENILYSVCAAHGIDLGFSDPWAAKDELPRWADLKNGGSLCNHSDQRARHKTTGAPTARRKCASPAHCSARDCFSIKALGPSIGGVMMAKLKEKKRADRQLSLTFPAYALDALRELLAFCFVSRKIV